MTTTPPGEPDPGAGPEEQAGSGAPAGTATSDSAASDDGPRVRGDEVRDLGRLRRTVGPDRYVAGVGGGLARHLDVDPVIVRVAFAVLAFFGGAGLLLYAVAWLVVPEDGAQRARIALDPRSRAIALVGTGVIAGLALLGDALGGSWFPWPVALVALVVFLVVTRRDRRAPAGPPAGSGASYPTAPYLGGQYPTAPYPGGQYPTAPYPGGQYPTAPYPGGQSPGTSALGWVPPAGGPPAGSPTPPAGWMPPPPPRNLRRRGPRLFPVTLAAIAFAVGLLGVLDVAGVPVAGPAYPALALGVVAAMLLLASVWGRGGGLIALGLLCSVVLAASSAADRVEGDQASFAPTAASDVRAEYDIGAGELVVDLSRVRDRDALDDRVVRLSGGIGRVEVIVPEEVDVEATATVHGPGGLTVFTEDAGGVDTTVTAAHDGGEDAPRLSIDADLGVGEIEVRTP